MRKKSKLMVTLLMCLTLLCSISAPAMAISIDYFYSSPTGDINVGESKSFWWKVSDFSGAYQYKLVGWDGQQIYNLIDWTTCTEDDYAWGYLYPNTRGDWEVDIFIRDDYTIYEDDFFTVN